MYSTLLPSRAHGFFIYICSLCTKYSLPSLLDMLSNPVSKQVFASLIKRNITSFLHVKLCENAKRLQSLNFLCVQFLPFGKGPHQLWLSCQGSRLAIQTAIVQQSRLASSVVDTYLIISYLSGLVHLENVQSQAVAQYQDMWFTNWMVTVLPFPIISLQLWLENNLPLLR